MNCRTGSILILTLWTLTFLTIFAVGLSYSVSGQLRFARHLQARLKMYYLANAGIQRAIIELAADEDEGYDGLNETWANSEEFFKEIPLDDGYITVSYTMTGIGEQAENEDERAVLYGVMDETSKININKASADILEIFLERIGELERNEAADIANAIVDWRDKDAVLSRGGAEDNHYKGLEPPYECKNGEFQAVEELLLVKEVTPEVFSKIQNVITIYGEGKININTVDVTTLYGLGLNMDLAERIVEFRQGSDGEVGTEDDNIFTTTGELTKIGPFFTEESNQISRILSMLTVKSDIFRISSSGIFKSGQRNLQRTIICVVQREKGKGAEILYWHQD